MAGQRSYICIGCGKQAFTSPSRTHKKFCSMECKSIIAMSADERRRKQKVYQKLKRGSNSGRNTRSLVWKVKPKQCEICGYNKREYCLEVHHIDCTPTNNQLDNLAVLCVLCHRELHKGDLDNATQTRFLKEVPILKYS